MKGYIMQERVHPVGHDFADIVVQFGTQLNQVGVGIEPNVHIPQKHIIDQMYGDVSTQTEIGRIFYTENKGFPLVVPTSPDEEAEYFNSLGRCILDSVTGSKVNDGFWTWFDRPQINRLIRLLRKARDASFGRDE